MIKNFNSLANTGVKKKALKILDAGLTAAQPKKFLERIYQEKLHSDGKKSNIFV